MKTTRMDHTRTKAHRRWVLAIALGVMTPLAGQHPSAAADNEFPSNTPYYEDDAWYDISEWFDGNDYNPTDEAIGRWDNETFDAAENVTSSDNDNFLNWGESSYGYYGDNRTTNDRVADDRVTDGTVANNSVDDRWFYDYYDHGNSNYSDYDNDGYWDYTANYYDYDNDGVYDSVAEYVDTDRDGLYESFNYIGFSDANAEQDKKNKMKSQNDQKSRSSQVVSRQGSIQSVKKVKTPHGTNVVVALDGTNQTQGQDMIVDIGSSDHFDSIPQKGQDVSAKGAIFKVGDKSVLVANKVTLNGEEQTINRSGREFTGKVKDLKTMKVRGNTHQFAKIKTDNDKNLLVDMGPQENLNLDVQKGSQVTVTGTAVKVKDRVMLIAREVTTGDKSTQIERVALKP
ncbi:hypothetical protein [Stieleria varia]|uniref:Magnetosome protein MamS/MamX domain-containing protein n=1 Tax=Stieleria varia TaxID=2528005 RepID=A0A5C6B897_9BACT|nr:hypothetical protein [Stieleria varia]TWU08495.1 hypothetical protein Pla52n_10780 [Stieleria varia]